MTNKKGTNSSQISAQNAVPSSPYHFKGRRFHLLFTLIVGILCFVIYGNGISNGYSLDDEFVLHGDTTVQKGIKGIPELFKSRYAWDQKGSYGYRPVVKTAFAIEDQFFGASPHAGHVINILIYIVAVIFTFYFLRKILYEEVSDYFLLITTALFITHPLHTEVVDSLKNRDALLSYLFGLACAYSFIKSFETQNIGLRILWIVAGCISVNLGHMAKPDAILFVAITPLVLYFFVAKTIKAGAFTLGYMLIGGIVCRRIIKHILPHSDYHRTMLYFENPLLGTHWYQRIQLGFSSFWFYINKLIFPKDLIAYYGFDEIHPFPKWSDINVLLGILAAGITLWCLYKQRKNRGVQLFSMLLLFGTIAAFVNVIRVGPGIVAERFMFIPSMGFVLVVSLLLFHYFKTPLKAELKWSTSKNLFIVVSVITTIYSIRVVVRNPNWKSHLSIYEHDAKLAPRSAKLQSLLAAAYIEVIKKDRTLSDEQVGNYYQQAEQAFKASVEVYPTYQTSLNNIGMIEYLYYRNMDTALKYFQKAIAVDSNYTEGWFNAASSYRELKNYPMAEKFYLKTIQVNPGYDRAYIYLSKLYETEGKYDEALKLNESAIKSGHASDATYIDIGKIYMVLGDTVTAIDNFNKALQYYDKNEQLCDWLARYYFGKKDTVKAQYYIKIKESAEVLNNEEIKQQ